MHIHAKLVVQKMEQELEKLKKGIATTPPSPQVKEQLIAIKTYCDLLLSSDSYDVSTVESGKEDRKVASQRSEKLKPYDDDELPESDSLLDF